MKKIFLYFLFISISSIAQQFDEKWNTVITLEKEGKIKSASVLVDKIYKTAVANNNETQIIKCFFYNSKYIQTLEEDAQTKILRNLKHHINAVSEPSKAILNFVYGKCLADYYDQNSYKLRSRITTDSLSTNFLLWSNEDLKSQIDIAYKNSIVSKNILKKTSLKSYQSIFDQDVLSKISEQNLYYFLLDENINYYTKKLNHWNIETSIYKKYKDLLFGDSNGFTTLNLDFVKDPISRKLITLYQIKETETNSLINRFKRMQFCNTVIKSDIDYLNVLEKIQYQNSDPETQQTIQLEKAKLYASLASKDTYPDYNIKALTLLDSILIIKNRSNAHKIAGQKKQNIEDKVLNIQLLQNSYQNENTRAFISSKNVNNLSVSFFKIDNTTLAILNNWRKERDSLAAGIIEKNILVKSINYSLTNKNDYFNYTTEIVLPQLEIGTYMVYFESDSDLKNTKAFAYQTIIVSNLSVLTSFENNTDYYQVLDRKTGNPIEKASIKFNNTELTTDKNGDAFFKRGDNNYNNFEITITKENDTLITYKRADNYNTIKIKEDPKAKVEFYLDRAIYRPGQTVYYKGIAFREDDERTETKVVPNVLIKIILKDHNNKEIQNFEVTTNSFGSFSGEVILPKNGLSGNMTLEAGRPDDTEDEDPFWDKVKFENSRINFKLEEYKRPKFEVYFEPNKQNNLINQNIKVEGTAKSFSGANISDSKVTYRISYEVYNNNQDSYIYRGQGGVIGTGETTTNASGKFTINFLAKADDRFPKENLPVFSYRITADVTDSNGETHSSTNTINVGYHTINLKINAPKEINTKDKNALEISTKNLNGQFVAVKGEINLYFIRAFPNKIKPRTWPIPEIETIAKPEFEKLFPFENNEKPITGKETGTLVYSRKIDTEKDKNIALDFISNYKSGYYKAILTAVDENNFPLESQAIIEVNQSAEKLNHNKIFTVELLNENPKKDGFVLLNISSIIPNQYIKIISFYESILFYNQNKKLKNNQLTLQIPLNKSFKNSIKIGLETIFENQYFNQELIVPLIEEEKKLDFSVESFRNKIQPGKEENWSFKIAATNTNVESEVLASMYDSSLDQIHKGYWNNLNGNQTSYNRIQFREQLTFDKTYATLRNLNPSATSTYLKEEATQLMWFGFNFTNPNDYYSLNKYQKYLYKKNPRQVNNEHISGYITDQRGESIPGVGINVKDKRINAISDYEGYYEINAKQTDSLIYSHIGYQTQTIAIDKNTIDVALKEGSSDLKEEVIIYNYSSREKKSPAYSTQILDRKVSAESIRAVAAVRIVEEADNQVYNTAGSNFQLESRAAGIMIKNATKNQDITNALYIIDSEFATQNQAEALDYSNILTIEFLEKEKAVNLYGKKAENGVVIITTTMSLVALANVKARKNLSETAFFYPHLKTDSKGNINFNFNSPEALTAWKLRLLAHNKNAVSGYLEKIVVTQKDLMVIPNFPRFFREKDSIQITTKIANMTSEPKTGIAILKLFDASTMEAIDVQMLNEKSIRNYTVSANGNTTVSWNIYIPEGLQGVQYKVLAKAGNFSDGEENILPVLTNKMIVTESIPIWVRENSTKEYTFDNLKNNNSSTLRNHQFTFEYTSNPAWIAIQSLPYLMEYEHECAEQTFARFYANALASAIISSNPKIATVFDTWRKNGKINSKLEENEELKSIVLAETPWLNDAQSEDEKKSKLALLFDLEKMKNKQEVTFDKLKQKQKTSGGFVWFGGNEENEYITRHILSGLGHLAKLDKSENSRIKTEQISKTGIPFLDKRFEENYKQRTKNKKENGKPIWLEPNTDLHYLYTRSFYIESNPISDTLKKIVDIYLENAKENWLSYSLYEKGMASLVLNRFSEKNTAKKILENLRETASNNEDWGMYWIANKAGWYWHQAPIETQALLIEAFAEIDNDTKSVDAMKVWLLKNKQTKNWPTTKATTEAVYALLMQGTDWLSIKDNTRIKIGDEKILTKKLTENEKEAETGYLKLNWKADEIKKETAVISIENKSKVPGFGGIYWQYFEDSDKIKDHNGSVLSVTKELYLKKNTDKGEILQKATSNYLMEIGDLVSVRLIITAKENMEFIHLKDMRASCFEPVKTLSEHQYKDGLSFYQSTKDVATHFFFDSINKGTYVIEYDILVNNKGDFSNGITTIQSMYAPEFSSHTKGIRVKIK
ncbi:MG2 domain-containing protein [Flavobacterium sp. K5-23]|uniref:alpha-2-macroglobulin family protein n=1 Tax=Flavobacterium sp. K5-23 TaxID=2746225 RepID=UPI00200D9740|nr:MG2 domain-containing protein [Flavobacterium sp. K5-23]UQD56047.1 carboxypeptidase-like regulatory domain-containing protein [Flavobacterium sp. K5-23]